MIIIKPFHHLGLCPWLLLGELLSGAEAMAYGSWVVRMIMVEMMVEMTVLIMVSGVLVLLNGQDHHGGDDGGSWPDGSSIKKN